MSVAESGAVHWLRCQLNRGMFSDEVAVTYPVEGRTVCSVFVPRSDVRGEPEANGVGTVRVNVLRLGGKKLAAVLPTSDRAMVAVQESDLSEDA